MSPTNWLPGTGRRVHEAVQPPTCFSLQSPQFEMLKGGFTVLLQSPWELEDWSKPCYLQTSIILVYEDAKSRGQGEVAD